MAASLLYSPRGWHHTAAGRRYTVVVSVSSLVSSSQTMLILTPKALPANLESVFAAWITAGRPVPSKPFMQWVFLTGDKVVTPAVAVGAIVTLEFMIPSTIAAGTYCFRLFVLNWGASPYFTSPNFKILKFGPAVAALIDITGDSLAPSGIPGGVGFGDDSTAAADPGSISGDSAPPSGIVSGHSRSSTDVIGTYAEAVEDIAVGRTQGVGGGVDNDSAQETGASTSTAADGDTPGGIGADGVAW